MVVGDDAQSIYSWRGANYQNILDFPKRYPNARVYRIETKLPQCPGDCGLGERVDPGKPQTVLRKRCAPTVMDSRLSLLWWPFTTTTSKPRS